MKARKIHCSLEEVQVFQPAAFAVPSSEPRRRARFRPDHQMSRCPVCGSDLVSCMVRRNGIVAPGFSCSCLPVPSAVAAAEVA